MYPSWHKLYEKPKPKFNSTRAMSIVQISSIDQPNLESGKSTAMFDQSSVTSSKETFDMLEVKYNQLMQMISSNMKNTQMDNQLST